jgi:phage antirepressor YoqD-like protein/PIN domain nuclease of toxin-antitoxin system
MNNSLSMTTEQTMSSREIAELTGKMHNNVLRDIRKMISDLDIENSSTVNYPSNQGLTIEYDSHTKRASAYLLNRELTDCLLTGYSAKLRMAVIKRWRELEQQVQSLPDFTNPAEAAIAWAEQYKRAEVLQIETTQALKKIEEDVPKVGFYETVTQAPDTYDMSQVATNINARRMGRNNLCDYLRSKGVFRPNTTQPYQSYVTQGYFKIVTVSKNGHAFPKTVTFQRGIDYIIKLMRNDGLVV